MAENMETNATENVEEVTTTETVETVEDNKPSYEDLLKQLDEQNEKYTKLKSSFDKASSDVSSLKKDLKARKTAEELAVEERAENEKKLAIYEAMERYTNRFDGIDSATARKLAELDAEGDKDTFADVIREYIDDQVKKRSTEALLGRGRVNTSASSGNLITKEQFNSMTLEERSKLYTENKAEYDRLKN